MSRTEHVLTLPRMDVTYRYNSVRDLSEHLGEYSTDGVLRCTAHGDTPRDLPPTLYGGERRSLAEHVVTEVLPDLSITQWHAVDVARSILGQLQDLVMADGDGPAIDLDASGEVRQWLLSLEINLTHKAAQDDAASVIGASLEDS